MPGGSREHSAALLRRDAYRLFLALTRLVIDPLVAGQLPGTLYPDLAANAEGSAD